MTALTLIFKLFDHFCKYSRLYLFSLLIAFLILGLWPFNFSEKNNAVISHSGALEIARHGTAYTAAPADKLHDLKQFAIYIDLSTSSDGLSAFEKIFSYFMSQEEMNFLLGQWKDEFLPVLRADQKNNTIKLGVGDTLLKGERYRFLLSYDSRKLRLYQDGIVRNSRETGALTFGHWDRTYPLVIGMDANGRSQWKGHIYEIAVFDRALTSDEVKLLSSLSGLSGHAAKRQERKSELQTVGSQQQQTTRQENPPTSPFVKGGAENGEKDSDRPKTVTSGKEGNRLTGQLQNTDDKRPLIHYVFSPENTYETTFRGRKALAVRDLGKGEQADLVIPDRFAPYQRVYLKWDPDWTSRSSEWQDVIVNVLGFIPFGMLFIFAVAKKKCLSVLVPECLSEEKKEGFGLLASGVGIKGENPPRSPFAKGGGEKDIGLQDKKNINLDAVVAVLLAVVAGFVVSFVIEYLQAYLPSRDSSLRDLVCNTAGTAMGAVAAALLLRIRSMC